MNDESAFLASLAANPGDSALRLVYADWLEERNDPRAEYVRLQYQLAATLTRLRQLGGTLDADWKNVVELRFDLVLHAYDPANTGYLRKLVREHCSPDLRTAVNTLSAPFPIILRRDLSFTLADHLQHNFARFATVTIEPSGPS